MSRLKNKIIALITAASALASFCGIVVPVNAKAIKTVIADFGIVSSYSIFSPSSMGSTTSSDNVVMSTDAHMDGRESSMKWPSTKNNTINATNGGGQRYNFENAGVTANWSAYTSFNMWVYAESDAAFNILIYRGVSQANGYWSYNVSLTGTGWRKISVPFTSFTSNASMNTWDGLYNMAFANKSAAIDIYIDSLWLEGKSDLSLSGANPPNGFEYMPVTDVSVDVLLSDSASGNGTVTLKNVDSNTQIDCSYVVNDNKMTLSADNLTYNTNYKYTISGFADSSGDAQENDIEYSFKTMYADLSATKPYMQTDGNNVNGFVTFHNPTSDTMTAKLILVSYSENNAMVDCDIVSRTISPTQSVTAQATVKSAYKTEIFAVDDNMKLLRYDTAGNVRIYTTNAYDIGSVTLSSAKCMGDNLSITGSVENNFYPFTISVVNDNGEIMLLKQLIADDNYKFSFNADVSSTKASGGKYTISVKDADGNLCFSDDFVYMSEEDKVNFVNVVNDSTSVDTILTLFRNYTNIKEIADLSDNGMKMAATVLYKQKPFTGFTDIIQTISSTDDAFNELNQITADTVEMYLVTYSDMVLTDTTAYKKYTGIFDTRKLAANQYIASKIPFDDFSEFELTLAQAVHLYTDGYFNTGSNLPATIACFGNPNDYDVFSPESMGSMVNSEFMNINTQTYKSGSSSSMKWLEGKTVTASTGGQRYSIADNNKLSNWSGYTHMYMWVYTQTAVSFIVNICKTTSLNDGYWIYTVTTAGTGWEKIAIPLPDFTAKNNINSWDTIYSMYLSSKIPSAQAVYFDSIWLEDIEGLSVYSANSPVGYQYMPVQNAYAHITTNNFLKSIGSSAVTDKDGNTVCSANAELKDGRIDISVSDTLNYDTQYTINISDCTDVYNNTKTLSYTFKTAVSGINSSKPTFSDSESQTISSVRIVNPQSEDKNVTLYIMSYDENGVMLAWKAETQTVSANSEKTITTQVDKGAAVHAFVCTDGYNLLRYDIASSPESNKYTMFTRTYDMTQNASLTTADYTGDILTVSGVSDNPSLPVILDIKDSNGNKLLLLGIQPDKTGKYTISLNMASSKSHSGNYTVNEINAFGTVSDTKKIFFISDNGKTEFLNTVNNGSVSQIKELIIKYVDCDLFNDLTENERNIIAQSLSEQKTFINYDNVISVAGKIKNAYRNINTVKWSGLGEYLLEFGDIALHGYSSADQKFLSLGSSLKAKVCKTVCNGQPFSDFAQFRISFQNAVNSVSNTSTDSGGGGGSGGGSSSNSGMPAFGGQAAQIAANTDHTNEDTLFMDISDYDWAKDSILILYEAGAISLSDDKKFRPEDNIKKEEFVKLIMAAFKFDLGENSNTIFKDQKEGEWYNQYIAAAANAGLVTGKEDGSFGIGENISRQDMAAIAYRAVSLLGKELTYVKDNQKFTDRSDISDFAVEAVDSLYQAGIISGMDDNTFAPNQGATRAQAAKITACLLDVVE